nr:immunoglobulin light chain junction region [Macaca mulatta]MOW07860.1 immunoglobulin light chain junction region [Macaca mulatta]MOW08074.1 immunoglobulin light chain junction region [Macaca mulatta]MOW08153.1 immunoglobulin light chain junction region [Macaca mulatta]MOW08261.1 immunoglobulin light chain junction region [Macaca mulatta]
CQKYSSSPNSF